MTSVRRPGKQGSWYLEDPAALKQQLHYFLDKVPAKIDDTDLPIPGARIIIGPHAGYSYSGAAAAWAYKALDLSKAKRVFVLGPSHTFYLHGCAVTGYHNYGTPFGNLRVDRDVIDSIRKEPDITVIPTRNDDREHSLEMHLPYLWVRLEQTFGSSPDAFPPVVPIMVGDGDKDEERRSGAWLAKYLADPENAFIVSSDFCHWGDHFSYRPYNADATPGGALTQVSSRRPPGPGGRPIHETIKMLDDMAIDAIKTGEHGAFFDNLAVTKNTVCGRHPIGVTMAGLEKLRSEALEEGTGSGEEGKFKFVRYERSNLVDDPDDYSVSYVSAYAAL
ncbi:MEMO1 family [Plectosphaerella plurivora]|uniref:MEMO1 family n=1 Tax=Plectosphaerella plurivora TaxID=936078 RepID=A0A9P8V767_9PEZI|nr:MEMO1 family [Plectosphaerella plurivora]